MKYLNNHFFKVMILE